MTSDCPIDVATVQFAPECGAVERNRERTVQAIESCPDADLVVLPELATTGYVFESHKEVRGMAEPRDGETIDAWIAAAVAADVWVVGGFAERAEQDAGEAAEADEVVRGTIDPSMARDKQLTAVDHALDDRRPDLYD